MSKDKKAEIQSQISRYITDTSGSFKIPIESLRQVEEVFAQFRERIRNHLPVNDPVPIVECPEPKEEPRAPVPVKVELTEDDTELFGKFKSTTQGEELNALYEQARASLKVAKKKSKETAARVNAIKA